MNDDIVIKMINNLMDYWEEDTINLSFHLRYHPVFSVIRHLINKERYKDLVITTVLKKIEKDTAFSFIFLGYTLPKEELPEIPEDMRGKMKEINEMYLKWGHEKGYLK